MTKTYALRSDDQYPIRFLHVRPRGEDGMSKKRDHNNRVDNSYGGFTIAYNPLLMIRKDGTIGVCVELGVANCSGHDRYVKKIGREKSTNFLNDPLSTGYILLYIGEGAVGNFIDPSIIPLETYGGDVYVNERLFNLRNIVAERLGFAGY